MLHIYNVGGNIIALCQNTAFRHYPVAYDQLIIWREGPCVSIQIFNKDQSRAYQCGNGLTALATHLNQDQLTIHIDRKQYIALKKQSGFWINMKQVMIRKIKHGLYEADVGNKHLITLFEPTPALLKEWLTSHNISFTKSTQNPIQIQTHERGCGLTGSCASASVAVSAIMAEKTQQLQWTVRSPKGTIKTHQINGDWWQQGHATLIKTLSVRDIFDQS
jgi:diaminopimelate epimerase